MEIHTMNGIPRATRRSSGRLAPASGTNAFVPIWDKTVGAVARDREGELTSFEYYNTFLKTGWELATLIMPLTADHHLRVSTAPEERGSGPRCLSRPPRIADRQPPDQYGNQLINVWLARQGRLQDSMNLVEKLCFIVQMDVNTLEFELARFDRDRGSSDVEIQSLMKLAWAVLSWRDIELDPATFLPV